jgi:hypothetical protein
MLHNAPSSFSNQSSGSSATNHETTTNPRIGTYVTLDEPEQGKEHSAITPLAGSESRR